MPILSDADMGVPMGKELKDVEWESSGMICSYHIFPTFIVAVKEWCAVSDNLCKILIVNTPINNSQDFSVFVLIVLDSKDAPLAEIQMIYYNLIFDATLEFLCDIDNSEVSNMNHNDYPSQ